MPNICTARIRVRGRRDCVDEFIQILGADYSYARKDSNEPSHFSHIPHMYRIFECDLIDRVDYGMCSYAELAIECAWSVFVCMFEGAHTYFTQNNTPEFTEQYGPSFATNVVFESARLHLDIEIFSSEPGMCFQEHYRLVNGVKVTDECVDAFFVYMEDCETLDDFREYYPVESAKRAITESQFQSLKHEYPYGYVTGGFYGDGLTDIDENEGYPFKIPEKPNYLYLNVMCEVVDNHGR